MHGGGIFSTHLTANLPRNLPEKFFCKSVKIRQNYGFTFLVPAYPGCPGKEAVKWLLLYGHGPSCSSPVCAVNNAQVFCYSHINVRYLSAGTCYPETREGYIVF